VAASPTSRWYVAARFLEIQNLGLNLPFLLAFLLVASSGHPTVRTTLLVVVAFVAARNAGHSFNRWADRDVDARNPRTAGRLLVVRPGLARWALLFAAANAVLLVLSAYLLTPLALLLVPVAVALVVGYSYTKRFTSLTTVFLGLVEAITPAGAYAAVTDTLPPVALVASLGLLFWGTAFELIHSLGDLASDAQLGLASLPRRLGVEGSLSTMSASHGLALAMLALFGWMAGLRVGYFLGLVVMGALVVVVESWVYRDPTQSRKPFQAHFLLSALFLGACIAGLFGPTL
jgi:4-hydroxybenzoate polyprenyltransferase